MKLNDEINDLLERGVEDVFIREDLEKKLLKGSPLRIKLGFDPTGSKIHLGRAAILWKLRKFQDLGHTIVFIIGDFTAIIGDPSDKLQKRPMLTKEVVEENLKNYKEQVGKIIDLKKSEFHYNSKWLSELKFAEICALAESFSVQQMLNRRNFKERYENGVEISLREFMYPLMQGYDSVAIKADVEIGGFDQLFNLKAGRVIQKHYGLPEQEVLTIQMLEGADGRKMSTSWGNVINIIDEPFDMFGKVMSLRDELIPKYFLLATNVSVDRVKEVEKILAEGKVNPRDLKIELAKEIVSLYYGKEEALKAEENFVETFKKGGIPEDLKEAEAGIGELLSAILISNKLVSSKTEWRRLVGEGAVGDAENGEKITDADYKISKNQVFKIGKRRFIKVKVKS